MPQYDMTLFGLTAVALLSLTFSIIPVNSAPRAFLGVNTATWDSNLDTPRVAKLLSDAHMAMLRFPGGSTSDTFDWAKPMGTSTAGFAHLAEIIHAAATITTNYGSGSPQMAAAWVAYCNAAPSSPVQIGKDDTGRDWKTAGFWAGLRSESPKAKEDGLNHLRADHPTPYRFKNWEIGNECYGPWENDHHQPKHDPVEYAQFAIAAGDLMRRVDPTIRIGVVVTDSISTYDCQESVLYGQPQQPTSEWTPVLLSALSKHQFTPDFIAFHHYAQEPGQESDAKLADDANLWPGMVATLKAQLSYFYGPTAAKIGISCTECNSVSSNPGPQTTGEANARYFTKIAPIAYQLGLESLIWWDLHNGENTTGHDTHSPLNQFAFGDYGILGSNELQDKPYPVYYAITAFGKKIAEEKGRE